MSHAVSLAPKISMLPLWLKAELAKASLFLDAKATPVEQWFFKVCNEETGTNSKNIVLVL